MQIFYNGLNYSTKALVDAVCGGSITMKTAIKANLMFEELAKNNYQPPFKRGDGRKQGGLHDLDRISSLEAKFVKSTSSKKDDHWGNHIYASTGCSYG